jgi:hypothetical protein
VVRRRPPRAVVLALCSRCGKNEEHVVRSDTGSPASMCRKCRKLHSRDWRSANPIKAKLRNTWQNMVARCHNSRHRRYRDYGAIGIRVCERWRNLKTGLAAFIADMGEPPSLKHTLDRRYNSRGYSKSNCRWATIEEQNNNLSTNRFYEYDGRRQTISQWAREAGIKRQTLRGRLVAGWPMADALYKMIRGHAYAHDAFEDEGKLEVAGENSDVPF